RHGRGEFVPHDEEAHDCVGNAHDALQFRGDAGLALELDDDVVAFGVAVDLVSEPTLAPGVDVGDLAALVGDDVGQAVDDRVQRVLFQVRPEDDHRLIRSHAASPPPYGLWPQAAATAPDPKRPEQGYRPSIIH